ncbi:hypothetical protein [uncultured Phycicoccus sp.]|uniref:hypothetical protein n=1 Tax=uncultured Phycicoccus sp. TaxID=661422 RepID=UPI002628CD24|nr:hypothetical protein [uncultured Phycicoccus sp.]
MKKYLPIVTIAALGLAGCGGTTEAAAPAATEESTPTPSASVDAAKKKEKPSAIDDYLDRADKAAAEEKPSAIDDYLDGLDEAAAEPSPIWRCSYSVTYNDDWHDDVVCSNGAEEHRPYLREWDDFITQDEIMESAREYEWHLNGGEPG